MAGVPSLQVIDSDEEGAPREPGANSPNSGQSEGGVKEAPPSLYPAIADSAVGVAGGLRVVRAVSTHTPKTLNPQKSKSYTRNIKPQN